jgi:hypothetical protein
MKNQKTKNKEYPWGEGKHWGYRCEIIAKQIESGVSLIDLGAGYEGIVSYTNLSRYVPVDAHKCTERTILADFNKGELPDLDQADIILVQGVIEYLYDPFTFLKEVHKYGDKLITTYRQVTGKFHERRINNFTLGVIEEALEQAGWSIEKRIEIDKMEELFICITKKKYVKKS